MRANEIRQHFYRTGGNKPPLLLLHGFMDSTLTWLRTARLLENDYDIIMPDARGRGHTEHLAQGNYATRFDSQERGVSQTRCAGCGCGTIETDEYKNSAF